MPGQYREQRKHKRFLFRADMVVEGTNTCSSMDISESGVYLSTIQYFEENHLVNISIPLDRENLAIKGEVKYCQPGIGMGVMFVGLSDEQRVKIRELVKRLEGKDQSGFTSY
jgi:hypothetical protein